MVSPKYETFLIQCRCVAVEEVGEGLSSAMFEANGLDFSAVNTKPP